MAGKIKTIKAKETSDEIAAKTGQNSISERFTATNGSANKNSRAMSKADELTFRAWKKTYESHNKADD